MVINNTAISKNIAGANINAEIEPRQTVSAKETHNPCLMITVR